MSKLRAISRNIKLNCAARSTGKSEQNNSERVSGAQFGLTTDVRNRAVQAFWAMHVEAMNWMGWTFERTPPD